MILSGCDPSAITGNGDAVVSSPETLGAPLEPTELFLASDSLLIGHGDMDMSTQEDTVGQDPPSGGS